MSADIRSTSVDAFEPVTVGPRDSRYPDFSWGSNRRWVGTPDTVHVIDSPEQVVKAVQLAVDSGNDFAVRSGGHCYEDFVTHERVRTVIDLSAMTDVSYDADREVFVIEAGALLGDAYRTLHKEWGVTIPGGSCPTVGMGGHIAGGGYGPLSRLHGLTVDHLWGVELVVVDESGIARETTATCEKDDPNRELWWAHTGGGGGNFGVVTRYLFRTPGTLGLGPSQQLPTPPSELIVSHVSWSWKDLTKESFTRILRNCGRWYEENSGADSPYAGLFSQLKPQPEGAGTFRMTTQIDASVPDAGVLLDQYLDAVNEGTGVEFTVEDRRTLPWLHAVTQWPGFLDPDTTTRFKGKSAYMRKGFTATNLDAFHAHMTRDDYTHPGSIVMITAFGGRINTVAEDATASAQRDSVLKLHYASFWTDPEEDARHLGWIREFYADVYADTCGVPVSGELTDGCFINYADNDLADPELNTSGLNWHELYYKSGYRRLQAVKAEWDPKNFFHHSLSVEAD